MDCSPPGSSVHGILRQEYWSGLPFPSPGCLPNPGIEPGYRTWVSCIGRQILYRLSHQGSPKPVQSILRCIIFSCFTLSRFYIYFTISDNMKLLLAFFFFSTFEHLKNWNESYNWWLVRFDDIITDKISSFRTYSCNKTIEILLISVMYLWHPFQLHF